MSTDPVRRPRRPPMDLEVIRTEALTERMVRVVLGGPELSAYEHSAAADQHLRLVFPASEPGGRPTVRTYTVRRFDPAAGELWIDVVQHGAHGTAKPWAAGARPGDRVGVKAAGGTYTPDPDADRYLYVGDPAAFPAIVNALEQLPDDAQVQLVLKAHDSAEAAYLDVPSGAEVQWLLSDQEPATLAEAVEQLTLPAGTIDVFVHGESREVAAVRTHLTATRGLPGYGLSISGYWRRGLDEDGFRQETYAAG